MMNRDFDRVPSESNAGQSHWAVGWSGSVLMSHDPGQNQDSDQFASMRFAFLCSPLGFWNVRNSACECNRLSCCVEFGQAKTRSLVRVRMGPHFITLEEHASGRQNFSSNWVRKYPFAMTKAHPNPVCHHCISASLLPFDRSSFQIPILVTCRSDCMDTAE
eukprot:927308-Rhodomonas_salina.3